MEISEFIKTTICEIVNGVNQANESFKTSDASIPAIVTNECNNEGNKEKQNVINIGFDIALTVSKSDNGEVGGGIQVASIINIGGKSEEKTEEQTVSRVNFNLPLILPHTTKPIIINGSKNIEMLVKGN